MDINIRSQDRGEAAEQAGAASHTPIQIDPAASAALEQAIRSAKLGLKPDPSPKVGTDEAAAAGRRASPARFLGQAAVALLLVGAGWAASYMGTLANQDAIRRLETETARSQEILARLSTDLEALRETVVAFKDVEHTASTSSASERTELSDKVERLTIGLQEPGKKLSSLEERLGRMESQIMTALAEQNAKPATPVAPPVTEAALREEVPTPKPVKSEPVDGWVLREVYDGAALVENRNRRLYEVMPGGLLPGVGRIEAIERRGARWVVVTDKGFIGAYR
ncbi:hypothetical protein [Microvirga lotononidis]|uniref:Uncharacterized protein n=1 Tax=Microvirga lotononidis TaxID=864069 RepID=I4YM42_9HYPH|nr:hypothetical protein [Microvirga lotononidis]EIM25034.1 hypothetical protein MicloDRAFT_00057540 [Microvirga lotononidis]WQO29473.1 hypothetical protein U0023_10555 [Microvirga lotononidis]